MRRGFGVFLGVQRLSGAAHRRPVRFILFLHPAHNGMLGPTLSTGNESIVKRAISKSRYLLRARDGRQQARHGQIRPAEAVSDEIRTAIGKLASSQSSSAASVARLSEAASGVMSYLRMMMRQVTGHIMLPIKRCETDVL